MKSKYHWNEEDLVITRSVTKGDYVGHPFRGNQWTKGRGSAKPSAPTGTRSYKTKAGMVVDHDTPTPDDFIALRQSESAYDNAMESAQRVFDVEVDTPIGKIKAEVDNVDGYDDIGSTSVSGVITKDGAVIGNFSRTIDTETKSVYNESLELVTKYQGTGIGTTIMAHWEDQYARMGIENMTTLAFSTGSKVHPNNKMNGAYTWAKYGYKPQSIDAVEVLFDGFRTALITEGSRNTTRWSAFEQIARKAGVSTGGADASEFPSALAKKYGTGILKALDELPLFKDFLKGDLPSDYVESISWAGSKVPKIISKAGETTADVASRWMRENPIGLENDDPQFWEDIRRAIDND